MAVDPCGAARAAEKAGYFEGLRSFVGAEIASVSTYDTLKA